MNCKSIVKQQLTSFHSAQYYLMCFRAAIRRPQRRLSCRKEISQSIRSEAAPAFCSRASSGLTHGMTSTGVAGSTRWNCIRIKSPVSRGGFSLRMFHRSFGLMMIQSNIEAPCTLLDFPTLEAFREEIRHNPYDIIGISGIVPNIGKVRKMCELIRRYRSDAAIVIGGHITNKEGLAEIIDADHIVRGEGVRWFQRYLGQNHQAPHHPPWRSRVLAGGRWGSSSATGPEARRRS